MSGVIKGMDLFDVIREVSHKNKKFLALGLQELEEALKEEYPDQFEIARKIFLDYFNEFTRSTVRVLFGDVELAKYTYNDKRLPRTDV